MCFLTSVITWAEIHMYHKSYTCMPTIIYWDRYSQSLERKHLTFFSVPNAQALTVSVAGLGGKGKEKASSSFLSFLTVILPVLIVTIMYFLSLFLLFCLALYVVHPKTDEQRCRLQEACKDILLFKNLDQEQLSQVLDAMFERKVKPQEHVIDQGDDGDNFYVVERGLYDIVVAKDNQSRCVGRYDNHGSFGELALMYNTPRAATIVATTEGALWGLDRVTFRRIILKNNAKKRKTYELFIESVPLLKSLEASERMKIVDVIGEKVYQDGERIISQGDKADCFYIVESGEVKILIKSKTMTSKEANQEVEIARCHRGQYFGELALVTNKPRAASAYAVGEVKCLVMDVQAFERLLGPCMDIMKRNITHYEEQLVAMFGSSMDLLDPGN
uniref:cAMP-dependent protein kinase type II-alpha regulatory subunit n=1 Tax=Otus sunia TaxID=257818 RepID=A0A8C8AI88_9STRI